MQQDILFQEKQQFRQWWIWLILIFVVGDGIWVSVKHLRAASGFSMTEIATPLFMLLIPVAIFIFMFSIKLQTEIRPEGVYVRFFPIHKRLRFFSWAEMDQAYVRQYSPLGEYGGWGLRGLGQNRALNISGNKGLQLVMKDGRRLLIGTRKPDDIAAVLKDMIALQHIQQP